MRRLRNNDRFTRVKIRRLFALLKPKKGELILDLGSGVGTVMIALAHAGVRALGLDYSFKSLVLAKNNFGLHVSGRVFGGVCCDGRNVAIKDNSLDAVAAADFTEHLDDSMFFPTITEVYRILKEGGRFVVYTPSGTHLFERLKKHNIILKEDESHIGLRTMNEYCAIFTRAGFVVKETYFCPTDIPLFNVLESIVMRIPHLGALARRRICIRAVK